MKPCLKRFFAILLCLYLIFQGICQPVVSAERKVLKVGIALRNYWKAFYSESDCPEFQAVEVAKKLAQNLDVDIEIVSYPWERLLWSAENGDIDFLPYCRKTSQILEKVKLFKVPLLVESESLFIQKRLNPFFDEQGHIRLDLKQKRFSVAALFCCNFPVEFFDVQDSIDFYQAANLFELGRILRERKIDAVYGTSYYLKRIFKTDRFVRGFYKEIDLKPVQIFFGISKKSKFVDQFSFLEKCFEKILSNHKLEFLDAKD